MNKNNVVKNAIDFYQSLCESQGLLNVSASDDVAPGVKLKHLIDNQGWLPFIMIRTDEICKMLTGQRMWDAFYVSDPMALRGLSVSDFDSLDTERQKEVDQDDRPSAEIPEGAKSLIGLSGIKSAISFRNDQCYLMNLPKAYFINGLLSEGDFLPSLPVELFFAREMNELIISSLPALNQVMNLSPASHEVSR